MITLEELRPLQLAILDVYNSFKNICQENGLKYYMIGGCLIGAFRNSGFIPWDDDMDIAMPREDYNRLIDILRKSDNVSYIANHYLMDTYTSGSYLLKLCNPSVKYGKINSDGTVENFDASLSVFPLNGTPKTKIGRMIYEQRVKIRYTYLRFVRASHNGIYAKKHSLIERIGIMINNVMHIGKKTSIREAAKKLDDILQKYDYNSSNSVSFYTYGMSPFFWDKSIFSTPATVSFEGSEIPVPKEYHRFLTISYGDYRKLPPDSERTPKHIDFVNISPKQ